MKLQFKRSQALATFMTALFLILPACEEDSDEPDPSLLNDGPVYRAFEAAAIELDVPLNLLMATAYVETRWEMVAGESKSPFDDGSAAWGVMGLAEGRNLERAADVVEADIDSVKTNLDSNVRAAAALLSIIAANTLSPDYAERAALGDWRDVLADYGGFSNPETTISFQQEVMDCLRHGAGRVLESGEIIEFQGAGDAVDRQAYGGDD